MAAGPGRPRGAGIGGEAVLQAGKALKTNILAVAGAVLSVDPATLDVIDKRRGGSANKSRANAACGSGPSRLFPT